MLPNLSSLLISFSRPSCRFRIALSVRQEWQLRELPWRLAAQRSRTSTLLSPHTVVQPCIAFYDRLARTMCLCLVALSCSRCDVGKLVNPTLQIRRIGRRSAVALWSVMRPITADAPVSDVRHQHRSYTNRLPCRQLHFQPQNISVLYMVPNYTAMRQTHVNNLHRIFTTK